MSELKSKKRRDAAVFVENFRLIKDLLKIGHKPSHMFYVEGTASWLLVMIIVWLLDYIKIVVSRKLTRSSSGGAHTDTRMPEGCRRIPISSGQMSRMTDVESHQVQSVCKSSSECNSISILKLT